MASGYGQWARTWLCYRDRYAIRCECETLFAWYIGNCPFAWMMCSRVRYSILIRLRVLVPRRCELDAEKHSRVAFEIYHIISNTRLLLRILMQVDGFWKQWLAVIVADHNTARPCTRNYPHHISASPQYPLFCAENLAFWRANVLARRLRLLVPFFHKIRMLYVTTENCCTTGNDWITMLFVTECLRILFIVLIYVPF